MQTSISGLKLEIIKPQICHKTRNCTSNSSKAIFPILVVPISLLPYCTTTHMEEEILVDCGNTGLTLEETCNPQQKKRGRSRSRSLKV
jgi:hypothetical protein